MASWPVLRGGRTRPADVADNEARREPEEQGPFRVAECWRAAARTGDSGEVVFLDGRHEATNLNECLTNQTNVGYAYESVPPPARAAVSVRRRVGICRIGGFSMMPIERPRATYCAVYSMS